MSAVGILVGFLGVVVLLSEDFSAFGGGESVLCGICHVALSP